MPELDRVDIVIHELNHSGVSDAAITIAGAALDDGLSVRLVVVGEEKAMPFPAHPKMEVKFLGIKRGQNFFGKVVYLIHSILALSIYFAKARTHNVFVCGKEFISIVVAIRILFPMRLQIVGLSVISISTHLASKGIATKLLLNPLYKMLLGKADHIIAQSNAMAHELAEVYKVSPERMSVLYSPLQLKYFNSGESANNPKNKVLFIGRLTAQKDPMAALKIFHQLNNPDAKLEFIGDGDLEKSLKDVTTKLGLEKQVSFLGRQNDLIQFLQNTNVLILTSKFEGFGMVLAEAIACGVPIISFDCPTGPSEIVIEDVNGYLVPQGNREMFVKRLATALATKWDRRKIIETAAKFHPDITAKGHVDVMKAVFVPPTASRP